MKNHPPTKFPLDFFEWKDRIATENRMIKVGRKAARSRISKKGLYHFEIMLCLQL